MRVTRWCSGSGATRRAGARAIQPGAFLADEAFLLHRGDDPVAMQEARGAVVGGAESEDPGCARGGHSALDLD